MAPTFFYLVMLIATCRAELNGNEYVSFKKKIINDFHTFNCSRALESEKQTASQARATAQDMDNMMGPSLTMMVNYLTLELNTAIMMMEGTNAQGCVSGIASHMDNAIVQATDSYKDCADDMKYKITRLSNNLRKEISNYEDTYKRTISGIDNCLKTYPNTGSLSRLQMCVETLSKQYFAEAAKIMYSTINSPSMDLYMSIVGECAKSAAESVAYEGWRFIGMLSGCSKLSNNMEPENYRTQLNIGYSKSLPSINLNNQTRKAREEYSIKETDVEKEIMGYNFLQKSAYIKYMLVSRNESYYVSQISSLLQKYSTTITTTASDCPAQERCISIAQEQFTEIVRLGAQQAWKFDQNMVNQTRTLLEEVNDEVTKLSIYRQLYGNPLILTCFSQGYILAEDVINRCFQLSTSEFSIKISEAHETIAKNMEILKENVRLFSNISDTSSGKLIVATLKLRADHILYELQRCLYRESGTNYEVTTPYDSTAASTTEYFPYSPE